MQADFGSTNFWPTSKVIGGKSDMAQGGMPSDGPEPVAVNERNGDGTPK